MIESYISRVTHIEALQYNGNNYEEVLGWLGNQKCFKSSKTLRVLAPNPVKLIPGDYIIKDSGSSKISVLPEKTFTERYQKLLISPDECLSLII